MPEENISDGCVVCNPRKFRLERLDTWHTAYTMLTSKDWGEDYGKPSPEDVISLALFLDGAGIDD